MSFKGLTTRAAALLKTKPAERLKKEPDFKAPVIRGEARRWAI